MIASGLLLASVLSSFVSLFSITASAEADAEVVEVGEELVIEVAAVGGGLSTATVAPGPMPAGLEIGAAQGPRLDRRVERVPGTSRQVQVERLVWLFTVTPIGPGRFVVPPFTVTAGPESTKTPSIAFEAKGSFDPSRFVFVEARLDERPRYVGEPIDVELVIGVAVDWRDRLLQGETSIAAPWLTEGLGPACPAEATSALATGGPAGIPMRTADGTSVDMRPGVDAPRVVKGESVRFTNWSVTRRFVPRRAGACTLPKTAFRAVIATKVEPEGPFGNRVFATQTKLAAVDASPRRIEVRPLPTEGRPDDFAGLVGRLRLTVSAEPRKVRVGDSVRVRVEVTGEGNLGSTALPRIEVDGFKRFGVREEIAPDARSRALLYDLAPESTAVRAIPTFKIPIFDTTSKAYAILTSAPIPLEVSGGASAAAAPVAGPSAPLPRAAAPRGLLDGWWPIVVAFAFPIVVLALRSFRTRPPATATATATATDYAAAPPAARASASASRPARPAAAPLARTAPRHPRHRLKSALAASSLPSDPSAAASHIAAAFTHFLADLAAAPPERFRGVDLDAQLLPFIADAGLRARISALIADADAAAFAGPSPATSTLDLADAAMSLAKAVERAVHADSAEFPGHDRDAP